MNHQHNERAGVLQREQEHGRRLAGRGAEEVWGWRSAAGQARADRRAGFFRERLAPGMLALELGCGTGLFTRKVASRGAHLAAIDLSRSLLGEAVARGAPEGVGFFVADAHRLPYAESTFDLVYGSSVLHHLDVVACLAECFRILRPGGWIVFAEPNMCNPQILAERKVPSIRRMTGTSPDETAFVRFRLARRLRDGGFLRVSVKPHEFLHPATPRRLIPVMQRVTTLLERLPGAREIAGSLLISGQKAAATPPAAPRGAAT